jgi:hypothetical protein
VRIIENNDARVVVHWRYGLVDILYRFARVDGATGWGDWSDEYHTIYPDGVGVRKVTLHSSEPMKPHEWQESIIVLPPGKRPEDCLEDRAVTLVNMKGQTRTYSWSPAPPRTMNFPSRANIEVINIKSKTRPFLIVSPNPCLLRDGRPSKQPRFGPFGGGIKRALSKFPWWNHWPVAMIPSEGRYAAAADRASSSYITTGLEWEDHEVTPTSRSKIMLHGLSARKPAELVPLAKSWLQAPKLTLDAAGFANRGYSQAERAYVLTCRKPGRPSALKITMQADAEAPVLNPAFIIKGWGESQATLKIDGRPIQRGKDFRYGHRRGLAGTDLIVWIRASSATPRMIEIEPLDN